jgi:hypothetical protein
MEANSIDSINIIVIPVALESKVLRLLSIINVLYCNSAFDRTNLKCTTYCEDLISINKSATP